MLHLNSLFNEFSNKLSYSNCLFIYDEYTNTSVEYKIHSLNLQLCIQILNENDVSNIEDIYKEKNDRNVAPSALAFKNSWLFNKFQHFPSELCKSNKLLIFTIWFIVVYFFHKFNLLRVDNRILYEPYVEVAFSKQIPMQWLPFNSFCSCFF